MKRLHPAGESGNLNYDVPRGDVSRKSKPLPWAKERTSEKREITGWCEPEKQAITLAKENGQESEGREPYMIDPIRHRQLQELNMVELCIRILQNARNELYLNMRYLDLSLSSLGFEADLTCRGVGTDGFIVWYHPEYLCDLYRKSRILVNRSYLHMVFHCLFSHMDMRGKRDVDYWNLACDIAVESVIDGLYLRCVHVPLSMYRRDWYGRLHKNLKVLNAEGVYRVLTEMNLSEQKLKRLAEEFFIDDHRYWELPEDSPKTSMVRQNQWSNNRDKVQTEMETMGNQQDEDSRSLLEQIQVENRERYDYKKFLKKFSMLRETLQVDEDSFDYVFYTYGLSMYGNMPLVEPLESKEINRIEDFVIVIDTSMSCSGELVRRFLEETCDVLYEADTYFKKTNIHIIQCDETVREDHLITSWEELEKYMENFTIIGNGGTDFRPAFEHVNQMIGRGEFHHLKGLLYFTDGEGLYPVRRPVYDTAFVFVKDQYTDISVPAWAIKLILEPEQLLEEGGGPGTAVKEMLDYKAAVAAAKNSVAGSVAAAGDADLLQNDFETEETMRT